VDTGHSEHTLCCIITASYPAVSSHSVHQHNLYIIVHVTHIMLLLLSYELHATFTLKLNCVRWLL